MTRRTLGNSNLDISRIGLGTWAIGGDNTFGWGPQEDADSIAAIEQGVERGINWVDTAPIYGFGHAENVVARALLDLGNARRPLVFTKCSLIWDEDRSVPHSLQAKSIRREVDASLERLGADVLKRIGERHGRSAGEVAIAWALRDPAVEAAIVGARNSGQVDGFIGAMELRLGEEDIAEISARLPESLDMMELD